MSRDPRPRLSVGLNLQRLEARDVPASIIWIGDNSNFNEADNWVGGVVPGANDTPVFNGPLSPPPYSSQSVTFPSTADLSFAGIEIVNGYAGTVTFPANVTFGRYTQTCGTTAQSAD